MDARDCEGVAEEVSIFVGFVFPLCLIICHRDYDYAVVIVHTHSDDETGDLWFTSYDPEYKGPASTPIASVCISLLMCTG